MGPEWWLDGTRVSTRPEAVVLGAGLLTPPGGRPKVSLLVPPVNRRLTDHSPNTRGETPLSGGCAVSWPAQPIGSADQPA